jgi:hypothetical protein
VSYSSNQTVTDRSKRRHARTPDFHEYEQVLGGIHGEITNGEVHFDFPSVSRRNTTRHGRKP